MTTTLNDNNDDTPIHLPRIRVWEIDENSTHYDKLVAAPSDEDMKLMWIFWSATLGVVTVFCLAIFIGVLLDQKARKNPFNVYLLCLMFPDILLSILCGVSCWINATVGHFYSERLCYFQSVYYIFGLAANSWLNAAVARQLYQLLNSAKQFRRYQPPTRKMVVIESLKVYALALFIALWGIIDQPWWPHKTKLILGTACVPIDYSTESTIFFYCVFFPALMGIPMGYVLYVLYRIKRDGLMPPSGKRRLLALYFLRLAAVFVLMWLPALVFLYIVNAWVHHWIVWAGGTWSHMQGMVSAALSLMKPDVYRATRNFITCSYSKNNGGNGDGRDDNSARREGRSSSGESTWNPRGNTGLPSSVPFSGWGGNLSSIRDLDRTTEGELQDSSSHHRPSSCAALQEINEEEIPNYSDCASSTISFRSITMTGEVSKRYSSNVSPSSCSSLKKEEEDEEKGSQNNHTSMTCQEAAAEDSAAIPLEIQNDDKRRADELDVAVERQETMETAGDHSLLSNKEHEIS